MDEKILIGADPAAPLYTFQQDAAEIKSCACVLSSSLVGDELAIDQFMPVVYHAGYIRQKLVPVGSSGLVTSDGKQFMVYPGTGFLDKIPYGTPIWYYSNNALMGKFYMKRALRSGKFWVDITAVSAIGILDGQKHYGGIYTGQKFRDVAADIIGGAVSFSCASSGQLKSYSVILPAGRMRGDVDGDGKFTDEDKNIITSVANEEMTRDDFDTQSWDACDVNADGIVNALDAAKSRNLVSGNIKAGSVGPEITGNWTNNPNYATDTAQFFADISVSGVTASDTASITAGGTFDKIDRVECLDGAVRVYVTLCPIEDVPCTVTINRTSGSGDAASENQDVGDIQIYGWLPIASRRENLHQLLFACGVMLDKGSNGDIYFRFPDSETYKSIPDSRIFLGGSVDYMTPATAAEVTEHAWLQLATDETVTLYDNTDGSGASASTFVAFQQAPVHDLVASGNLTIESSGVNYAVVSGTGTLTGKKYTHVTKVLRKTVDDQGTEKTVSVTEATLVNIANSENVCQRVLSYYSSARTIQADVVLNGELPGDQISFNNPYNEPEMAFLSSMDVNASSFLRASCELVTGYVPSGGGNNYTQVVVLTGTGNYQFPAGTKKAVAVLISAGDGGCSGGKGKNATGSVHFDTDRKAGEGGIPGIAGSGGKILPVKLENPTGIFAYSCGTKGLGGVQDGTESSVAGTQGTATTFGPYSSENGQTSETGYVNLFSGEIYALPGRDGIAGGKGNDESGDGPNVIDHNGNVWTPGKNGASYKGDRGTGNGGYGGGAAVGANGENGGDGRVNNNGGFGGFGADGAVPLPGSSGATYGSGGDGGHGGGGGGAGGYGSGNKDASGLSNGSPGDGAIGSPGGDGADGVIVIYL